MRKCDQCDSATINGVFCHEHGCPAEHNRRVMAEICGDDSPATLQEMAEHYGWERE